MTFLYSLLTLPLSLIYGVVLLFSERKRPMLLQRFGFWGKLPTEVLWFHGASVGEVQGIVPIIQLLQRDVPIQILITVTSPTAVAKALEITPHVRLLPFDSWFWLARALGNISIRMMVVSETEVWPALYQYLRRRMIPVVVVNGRLSDTSVPAYQLLHRVFPELFASVRKFLCVDPMMAKRFTMIGIEPERIEISGNTKYCRAPISHVKGSIKKERFDHDGKLIVIGNIRPGEEEILFPAIGNFLRNDPAPLFAVVPRHTDKFEYFADLLRGYQIPFVRWSEDLKAPHGSVLLVDAFGGLEKLYADAQGAFIGGSLVDFGGHNPLEPAPYSVAVAIGPYTESSGNLVPQLVAEQCVDQVKTPAEVEIFFDSVNSGESVAMSNRLYEFWKRQQGAVEKAVYEIRVVLKDA